MTKKILFITMLLALGMSLIAPAVMAKQREISPDLPEQAGIYAVTGRPDLKLRVFVYQAKPDNPGKPAKPTKPEPPAPELICNLNDLNSNAEVGVTGWRLPNTWTYNLNPGSVPSSVGSANLDQITMNGFNEWLSVPNVKNAVTVNRAGDTSVNRAKLDGQNIIAWGRTSSSALAVTYTWYYPETGVVAEIDTLMNKSVSWMWSSPDSWSGSMCAYEDVYDAQNILTHELGHTFGLDDEYTDEFINNTMYGYGDKMEVKKDTLTSGDIAGVDKIY